MSLFKRKDSPHWWVKIAHNGRRVQQSAGTTDKAKAQEYHDKLKASLWDQERLGIKPKRTWNEAVVRYLAETTHKASQSDDKAHLRWVDRYLNGVELGTIGRDVVDRIHSARLASGASHSTVNRTMEVIRAVLRRAANEWEPLAAVSVRSRSCAPRSGRPPAASTMFLSFSITALHVVDDMDAEWPPRQRKKISV